jgi:putative nucleotidyltransferase with HDIG domain
MQIECTKEEILLLEKIAFAARKLQMPTYVIGGFVRDKIIGRDTKDIDIVCLGDGIALAEQVSAMCKNKPAVAVFKNFGTAQAIIDGIEVEFVGARKESYRADSRNPTVEIGTLEDDQNRRDLTINALAISLNKEDYGHVIDPFNGQQDIERKILRTPLEPAQTFSDDPLRMLRTIRFATQLQYTIEEKTLQALSENAPRIDIISKERIVEELNKILACKNPSIGFDLLYTTGILKRIFPELVDLAGAQYIDSIGHKDNFYHTIQVVDQLAPHTDNLWLRWAALLHDIGKPATKRFEKGHGWTFHNHEWIGSKMVPGIFKKLKLPLNEKMKYVQKLVQLHHRPVSLTKDSITDSAIRRLLFDAGEEIDDLMLLCNADITSKNQEKVKRFRENFNLVAERMKAVEEQDQIRNWQPPISGELIMQTFNLPPSKVVGEIKDAVREAILDGMIKNDYDEAYQFMIHKANELNIKAI